MVYCTHRINKAITAAKRTSMTLFNFWLTLMPTLITVTGPAILFAMGLLLVPAWRSMVPKMLLTGLACTPLSLWASYWGDGGLHIAPTYMAPMLVLMLTGKLDMRRHWFAVGFGVWAGTVVPDAIGAWLAFGSSSYSAPTWFWGIGGYGFEDGLVVYPLVLVAVLFVSQEGLARKWFRPTMWATWMNSLTLRFQ